MLFLPSSLSVEALVGKLSRSDLTLASPLLVKCSALKDKYVLSTGVCKLRTLNVSSPPSRQGHNLHHHCNSCRAMGDAVTMPQIPQNSQASLVRRCDIHDLPAIWGSFCIRPDSVIFAECLNSAQWEI